MPLKIGIAVGGEVTVDTPDGPLRLVLVRVDASSVQFSVTQRRRSRRITVGIATRMGHPRLVYQHDSGAVELVIDRIAKKQTRVGILVLAPKSWLIRWGYSGPVEGDRV